MGGESVKMRPKSKLYSMTTVAVMAAVLAVISPFALFLGPVPVSLCTLGICLSAYALGGRRCVLAVLVYVLLGSVGMPVFSGFTGGAGKLLGPTGGYIVGYLLLAAVTGWTVEHSERRWIHAVGMAVGTALLYLLGTVWYCFQAGQEVNTAVSLCVLPFLPFDIIKCALGVWLGLKIRKLVFKRLT